MNIRGVEFVFVKKARKEHGGSGGVVPCMLDRVVTWKYPCTLKPQRKEPSGLDAVEDSCLCRDLIIICFSLLFYNYSNYVFSILFIYIYFLFCVFFVLLLFFPFVLSLSHFLQVYRPLQGDRGSAVVKVLCHKSEGRLFDSRWCHWNFSLT